jgi:hypothetical protein
VFPSAFHYKTVDNLSGLDKAIEGLCENSGLLRCFPTRSIGEAMCVRHSLKIVRGFETITRTYLFDLALLKISFQTRIHASRYCPHDTNVGSYRQGYVWLFYLILYAFPAINR